MARLTEREAAALGLAAAGVKANKFSAVRTSLDGIDFDSKREADRYAVLLMLKRGGEIMDLKRQVRFPLYAGAEPIRSDSGRQLVYVADFTYRDLTAGGALVIEDAKGMRTPVYILKRAIMKTMGHQVREV